MGFAMARGLAEAHGRVAARRPIRMGTMSQRTSSDATGELSANGRSRQAVIRESACDAKIKDGLLKPLSRWRRRGSRRANIDQNRSLHENPSLRVEL
jgi:hypothetical protein